MRVQLAKLARQAQCEAALHQQARAISPDLDLLRAAAKAECAVARARLRVEHPRFFRKLDKRNL